MEYVAMAGIASSAMGNLQAGDAAKQAGDYNAGVLTQNAGIERQQADAREEAKRREAAMVLGSQRAAFGQSGGGMGGSAADVSEQSAINAELDALTIRYEGDLRARGMEAQAANERWAGGNAQRASRSQALGSILSGVASYSSAKDTQAFREESLRQSRSSTASSGTGLRMGGGLGLRA